MVTQAYHLGARSAITANTAIAKVLLIKSWVGLVELGNFRIQKCLVLFIDIYHKVANSNTFCLETHGGFFRLLMKGIFGHNW